MGLADRLKDLTTKAQDAVVERNEDIHKVVEKVAATADERTGGKYREQIQRAGAKAGGLIDGLKGTETPPATDAQTPPGAQAGTPSASGTETPPAAQAEAPRATEAETPRATEAETPRATEAETPRATQAETPPGAQAEDAGSR
jgi:MT0933-like antitoxin protein